jgi:hypothetical protein
MLVREPILVLHSNSFGCTKIPSHGYKYAKPLSPSKGSDPAPVDFSGWFEA